MLREAQFWDAMRPLLDQAGARAEGLLGIHLALCEVQCEQPMIRCYFVPDSVGSREVLEGSFRVTVFEAQQGCSMSRRELLLDYAGLRVESLPEKYASH